MLALDHSDHATGAVGTDVVPDDGVRSSEVVACQKNPPLGSLRNNEPPVSRARSSRLMPAMLSAPGIAFWLAKKLWPGFVHSHRTTVQGMSIQRGDRGFRLGRICHLDESDSTRLARIPVHDDRDADIEVPDKNVGH